MLAGELAYESLRFVQNSDHCFIVSNNFRKSPEVFNLASLFILGLHFHILIMTLARA